MYHFASSWIPIFPKVSPPKKILEFVNRYIIFQLKAIYRYVKLENLKSIDKKHGKDR
jgi:hypothetical protein